MGPPTGHGGSSHRASGCMVPAHSSISRGAGCCQPAILSAGERCSASWHSTRLFPDLADVLLLLPEYVVLSTYSHQVCCCRWLPCFYSRTLSCTVPACHAETSQILASTKYRRPPRFHLFSLSKAYSSKPKRAKNLKKITTIRFYLKIIL
jgi:hypothetical protein